MKKRPRPARPYESPLRERQSALTRESILAALVDQVARSRPGEYSIAEVAERAGVSVRTLYRHFGGREALALAVEEAVAARSLPAMPADLAQLHDYPVALFTAFDAHAPWVEAMLRMGEVGEVRRASKPRRIAAMRAHLAPVLDGLPPERATEAMAVIKHLLSAEAWRSMREDFGLDGPAAGRAVRWALTALMRELGREKAR